MQHKVDKPKILVGLGNPGKKYRNTRHNAGFLWVDKFYNYIRQISSYIVTDWKHSDKMECWYCEVKGESGLSGKRDLKWVLVKPVTYMNASGRSVSQVLKKYDANPKDLIVIHDDLDLEIGDYKVQEGRGPKGHNGILSINSFIGTQYWRVRLGVEARNGKEIDGDKYVLERFKSNEKSQLDDAINRSVKIILQKYHNHK
jgi:PTH1 family peptidyl-tRNA hydrolase